MKMKKKASQAISSRYAGLLCLGLACAVGLMGLLRVCSSPHPFASDEFRPSGGDTLDVAIQYAPLMLYTYDDTLGGFSYDLLRAMADYDRLPVKFHPIVSLSEALKRLTAGEYDLVVADTPLTSSFSDGIAFTRPIFLDRMVLVQPASDSTAIASQLDLAGREVWIPSDSPALTRLMNLADEIGASIIVRTDSTYGSEQLYMMVATHEIPLAVINRSTAERLYQATDSLNISTDISFTQFQSWLVSQADSATKSRIDTSLGHIMTTDIYTSLIDRYGLVAAPTTEQ